MAIDQFELQHPAGLCVTDKLTESSLVAALPGVANTKRDMRTGWVWYELPDFEDDEVRVHISLGFNRGTLECISLTDAHPRFGQAWSDWSEEKERVRAASIECWLDARGYSCGTYVWGTVAAGFDAKGGGGSAAVWLRRRTAASGADPQNASRAEWQLGGVKQSGRVAAILRQRCPRCWRGRVFAGLLAMHPTCPICSVRFEREPGYFLGAMYFSYALGVPIISAMTALLSLTLLRSWEIQWVVLPATAIYLAIAPAVFRYSRILWMHFDRHFVPDASTEFRSRNR